MFFLGGGDFQVKQVVLKSGVVLEADVVIAGIGSYFSTSVFRSAWNANQVWECLSVETFGCVVFANIALWVMTVLNKVRQKLPV